MIGVIYCIENTANGWCYIGSTLHEKQRLARHFRHLRKNKHFNKRLQQDFNIHGEDSFSVKIINKDIPEHLLHYYEIHAIDEAKNDWIAVYNISKSKRISPENRQRLLEKKIENKIAKLNANGTRQLTIPTSQVIDWNSPSDCGSSSCSCIAPHQNKGMRTNGACLCSERDLRLALTSLKQFVIKKACEEITDNEYLHYKATSSYGW